MPDEAAAKCIWQSVATFVGGGFFGTLLGHFLAIGRDSRNAKRTTEAARRVRVNEFKGFMGGFRSWVERFPYELGDDFGNRVHSIRQETAKIRDDVPPDKKARFDEAVTALCSLSNSEVSAYAFEGTQVKHTGQDRVCSAIDYLVETVG